jgi:peptide/nickel transport system substrate-binding protein
LLLCAITIIGCAAPAPTQPGTSKPAPSTPPATSKPSAPATPTPQYGGTLRIIEPTTPKALGYPPEITSSAWFDVSPALEALLPWPQQGSTYKPAVSNLLATDWKFSTDNKSLTVTLRKGVKFHDGTDFNAQAVKWNLEKTKPAKAELATITSIDVIDDYTVRLNLSQYDNVILKTLAGSAALMVSPTAVEKNGVDWARWNPVGTGPFKFVSFSKDQSLKFEKFTGYWDKTKPYLDGVEVLYIADPVVSRMAFEKGNADIALLSVPLDAKELAPKGFNISSYPLAVQCLGGDSANSDSPFADKKVREAVEYAINKDLMVKTFGFGYWDVATEICTPGWGGYSPSIQGRRYDPSKAKQLLTEAGYPNGFNTKILISTVMDRFSYQAVAEYLKAVGINTELEISDPAKWTGYQYGSSWKNALMTVGVAPHDPFANGLKRSFTTSQYVSIVKPVGWDALLNQALSALDEATATSLSQKLTQLAYDEAMLAPVWLGNNFGVKVKTIHDDRIRELAQFCWTPADAWFSK